MLAIAFYLLKVIICSGVLLGYYWLMLRNKIFHGYNRFYLLAGVLLSLSLPLLQITIWHNSSGTAMPVIKILQVVNSGDEYLDEIIISSGNSIGWEQVTMFLYSITSLAMLLLFMLSLIKIYRLFKTYPHRFIDDNILFINTHASGTPFSFLKYIFWNEQIDLNTATGRQIFTHEVAHIEEKHSYDKLFINIVLILFWSNPFFWIIRKELNMIHEFVADKKAVANHNSSDFAAMILQAAYPQHQFNLSNPFFYSPIKRRLLMLTKNKHPRAGYISRLLVLPLAAIVFFAFSMKAKTIIQPTAAYYKGENITVVIDAGHGGKDFGAASINGKYFEKEISLSIIKKIKALNTNKNINIVLTREKDIYQSPPEKATITSDAGADIMVSIHVGATTADSAALKSGINFFVAKDNFENAFKSKILASALIGSFKNNTELPVAENPQQRQMGIWLIQSSNCPAVLVETGFITNKKDLTYLINEKNQGQIARNILNGIENYAVNLNKKNQQKSTFNNQNDSVIEIKSMYVDVRKIDKNFIKSKAFEEHALIIVDDVEIGNAGSKSLFSNQKISYKSIQLFGKEEGIKRFGNKGSNGAVVAIYKNQFTMPVDKYNSAPKDTLPEIVVVSNDKAKAKPIYFLDGKRTNNISKIPPEKIDRVNVLKGNEAITRYGDAGKNGVVEIFTKSTTPLYLIDSAIRTEKEVKNIATENIESVHVLKNTDASEKYGDKGRNGAVEIITKAPKPLYVIDGIIKTESDMKNILPENIERVNVLKDKNATVKYGDKGKHGVVEIVTKQPATDDKVFTVVENEADFPGGTEAWKKYLMQNLNSNITATDKWKPGTYRIVVEFIVNSNGSIRDVITKNYPESKTALHCIDLIKKGPNWIPAKQNEHLVASFKKQPITFVVN